MSHWKFDFGWMMMNLHGETRVLHFHLRNSSGEWKVGKDFCGTQYYLEIQIKQLDVKLKVMEQWFPTQWQSYPGEYWQICRHVVPSTVCENEDLLKFGP